MSRPQRRKTERNNRTDDEVFSCNHCGEAVSSYRNRNHCPHCLWSRHVDIRIGDRNSACKGEMEPVSVWTKADGEWAIIHRCTRCGFLRSNGIAADDDEIRLFALAARPMTELPFPLSAIDAYRVRKL